MKKFRLILFLLFVFGSDLMFAQKGVYIIRDSTLNLPVGANFNTSIGTKSGTALNFLDLSSIGGDIQSSEYGSPIDLFTKYGENNTIFGSYAAFNKAPSNFAASMAGNTIIGSKAGFQLAEGALYQATMIGAGAGYNSFGKSVMIGYQAGFGKDAATQYYSVLIGNRAGYRGGAGWGSTLIGFESGFNSSTSGQNTFLGYKSGYNVTGGNNVGVGYATAINTTSSDNVFLGGFAGYSGTNGSGNSNGGNTLIGAYAGKINNGASNTFVGRYSGISNNNGEFNVFLGYNSGLQNTIGNGNTFLGYESGRNITSGAYNTFIGVESGVAIENPDIYYSAAIGYKAFVSASSSMVLGGKGIYAVNVGIGNSAPQNRLEITSAATNTSGLRFTNLKSTSTPSTANSLSLSVDANGDVILVPAGGGGSVTPDSMLVKYIGATKFVGMGITSPTQKLHVSGGNLRVDNDLPRMYLKNTTTGTDITLVNLGADNIIKLANSAIFVEAFGGLPSLYVKNNAGNIGIGNTNPTNKLEITTTTANTSGLRFTNLKSTSTPSTANSLGLSVDANGDVILVPAGGGTLPQGADVWDQLTNGADYLIRNKNNKSVMIGTVAAAKTSIDYKLYVEKGILAEKVKVSAQANWPDYVFGKDYSLMPLKEVENYITTNNHLPEVPSAEVIAKDGLDLGKMDATLLKKVEELTLYLIEQSKQLSAQQQTILKLQEKINSIEQAKK